MNQKSNATNLPAKDVQQLTGQEPFYDGKTQTDARVQDFWRWSCSNLLGNTLRGVLAEYIVGLGLECLDKVREEWDAIDLEWKVDGERSIRIEVKSAAYLQSWNQEKVSEISFDIAAKLSQDTKSNVSATEAMRSSDVYVFCLLHHREKSTVDPMDFSQWSFYAVSAKHIYHELGTQQRLSLGSLEKKLQVHPFEYAELKERVWAASNWQPLS